MATASPGLRYTESGHGDAVVLLDWTPWETRALSDALAVRYRVISIAPPSDVGAEVDVVSAVASLAAEQGLGTYTIVGTSLGADAALRVALDNDASVDTLVLVSPTCVHTMGSLAMATSEQARDSMLAHPGNGGYRLPGRERTVNLATLAERLQATTGLEAELPRLACATLVVIGQEDRFVARTAGGVWKDLVPNCSLSYMYDAGHAVGVDRPEALHNVVLDFVERRETFIVENRPSLIFP